MAETRGSEPKLMIKAKDANKVTYCTEPTKVGLRVTLEEAAPKNAGEPSPRWHVTLEQETDGRWIGEMESVPGAMAYGETKEEAAVKAAEIARAVGEPDEAQLKDAAMLLRLAVMKLKKGDGSARCFADKITDWLKRNGLQGSILRTPLITLLLLLSGCAVGRAPVRAYHKLYCQKMNVDHIHCDSWATPCGRLQCQ